MTVNGTAQDAHEVPAPTVGLIASLGVRTWLEHAIAEESFPVLLLTYRAPQFDEVDPSAVERTMRGVAASLGAAPLREPLPHVGVRVAVRGFDAFVSFAGCSYALMISHLRWAQTVALRGQALLAVGLDELSPVASSAEIDEYLERAGERDRLYVALAEVDSGDRDARAALRRGGKP